MLLGYSHKFYFVSDIHYFMFLTVPNLNKRGRLFYIKIISTAFFEHNAHAHNNNNNNNNAC